MVLCAVLARIAATCLYRGMFPRLFFVLAWMCLSGPVVLALQAGEKFIPIDISGFSDSTHHWREIRDGGRFIQADPDQPAYAPEQVREIAANILLFQRENGGWPKDYDMTAILTDAQKAKIRETRKQTDTSFDNGNLHSQVLYLARAYAQSPDPEWRQACERGFDFILSAQYANGGFPHRFPKPKDFHAYITFNDGGMIGCLDLFKDAADGAPHFLWLDPVRRAKAEDAVKRGIECILKCQIKVDGELAGWCQQHDDKTYEARPARTFELASVCPQDTTAIVRFLMRIESPSAEVKQSIKGAVEWLKQVRLTGIRVDKVEAEKAEFQRHTADFDKVVIADVNAPALWARHYEIGSNRPVFAGRDGIKKYALAEIERERRTGTPWYGNWPEKLIEKEYPQWRKKNGL